MLRTQVQGSVLPLEDLLQSTSGASSIKTASGASIQDLLNILFAYLPGVQPPTTTTIVPNPTFQFIPTSNLETYMIGHSGGLDYGIRVKVDPITKVLSFSFKGFASGAGNPAFTSILSMQVKGATITGSNLSYSAEPLTLISSEAGKYSSVNAVLNGGVSDTEEVAITFTLSELSDSTLIIVKLLSLNSILPVFISVGSRLISVSPSTNFEFGFNPINNSEQSVEWSNIVGVGKPEDNATHGSPWNLVSGTGRPEDFATYRRTFLDTPTNVPTSPFESILFDITNGNHPYVFSQSTNSWVSVQDTSVISTVNSIVAGKCQVFFQTTQPISANQNDLWIDTDAGNKWRIYQGSYWVLCADTDLAQAIYLAQQALSQLLTKSSCYLSDVDPRSFTDILNGDFWYSTTDQSFSVYSDDSSGWIALAKFVDRTSQLIDDAEFAQKAMWGKVTGTLSNQQDLNTALGTKFDKTGGALTGPLTLVASSASTAGFIMPVGTAPTSPTNGMLWATPTGFFGRVNNATFKVGDITTGDSATFTSVTISSASQRTFQKVVLLTTSDDAQSEVTFDGAVPSTDNRLFLIADSLWYFSVQMVGRNIADNSDVLSMILKGVVSMPIGGPPQILSLQRETMYKNSALWEVDVNVDVVFDVLRIMVTGETSKTIKWVAKVDVTEVVG